MYFLAILVEEERNLVFKTVFATSIEKGLEAFNSSHSFTTPCFLASFHLDKAPANQLLVVVVLLATQTLVLVVVLPLTQILVVVMVLLATQILVWQVVLLPTQLLSDCCSPAPE